MKKICMFSIGELYGKQTGGIKRFKELYNHLIGKDYHVDLFCAESQEKLKENNIYGYSLTMQGKYKGFLGIPSHAIYLNNKEIYEKIRMENYDCVISFDVPSTIGLCLAGVNNIYYFVRQDLITYRKIQYEHINMNKLKMYVLLFCGWVMEEVCVRKSKIIVSQCRYDINQIISRHRYLKKRILSKMRIQINNINPSWAYDKMENDDNVEKVYDIAYVGNFDDNRKGYKLFLDAITLLREAGKEYNVVMLGEGKELQDCKKKYSNYSINFTGFEKYPINYLKKSKLMVVPSYADSCPNTIMESLKIGVPVIGADRSGIPEILTDEAWRFQPEASCLADKIISVFEENRLNELIIMQNRRAKELTFNWGEAVEKIIFQKENL